MKLLRASAFVLLIACTAAQATAQYGLYARRTRSICSPCPRPCPPTTKRWRPRPIRRTRCRPSPRTQPQPTPVASAASDQLAPVPQALAEPSYQPQPSYLTTNQPQATAGTTGNGCAGCGVFSGLVDQYHQAACGEGCCGCGGYCGCCGCGCDWYAQVLGLIMTRDRGNKLWTTYENGNASNQIMNTQDAKVGWEGGGEIRFGRCFCCGQYAIEADFSALNEFSGYSSATSPVSATNPFGIVSTPLTTGLMLFNGFGANGWFDNAEEHRLWRTDEVYNVELNMIRNHLLTAECGCPLSVDVLAGVRYFRFRENLTWGTLAFGSYWGENGGADEAYVCDSIANNLIGGQIGFNVNYCVNNRLRLFVTPKIALCDNVIENDFRANLGNGTVATQNSYPGMTYPVHSSANEFSILTQIDAGIDWQITRQLSACVGYRVVAATGMGLADNQIPPYLNDIPSIQDIDTNGHLILHGAFAGLTYCF